MSGWVGGGGEVAFERREVNVCARRTGRVWLRKMQRLEGCEMGDV